MLLHISVNGSLFLVPQELYEGTAKTVITTILSGLMFASMIWMVVRKEKEIIES